MEKVIDLKLIGQKLKQVREDAKISQSDLAKALDVSQQAICSYEIGERMPRDEVKVKYSKFFKKPVSELFYFAVK